MNPSHLTRAFAYLVAGGSSLLLAACATSTPPAAPAAAPAIPSTTPAAPATAVTGVDYNKPDTWLCRPGRNDVCALPLSVTTITPDGQRTKGPAIVPNASAPIDCFYVYPTVSNDLTPNSDMNAGPEEQSVTFAQLRSRFTGTPMKADAGMAYADVVAAWNHYLANDNKGRGVVLIGHSQGARMITELVAREVEGKPIQKQIVSVIPMGSNLMVPKGKDVGGNFKSTPLCRSASQTGCAISWVSFRANTPPPSGSLFGRPSGDQEVACNHPAALAGGATQSKVWFSKRSDVSASTGPGTAKWQALVASVDTPFFHLPGFVTTQCVNNANGSYLAAKANPDNRADDFGGDVMAGGNVVDTWGLHLVDVSLGIGDLIDVVGQQAKAYAAKAK